MSSQIGKAKPYKGIAFVPIHPALRRLSWAAGKPGIFPQNQRRLESIHSNNKVESLPIRGVARIAEESVYHNQEFKEQRPQQQRAGHGTRRKVLTGPHYQAQEQKRIYVESYQLVANPVVEFLLTENISYGIEICKLFLRKCKKGVDRRCKKDYIVHHDTLYTQDTEVLNRKWRMVCQTNL
jgi:hypothetical protein